MPTATGAHPRPPEVTSWGTPEQVFDLSAGRASGSQVFNAAMSAVGALLSLALAVPMLFCGFHPPGKDPAPAEVYFGIAGVTGAMGVAMAYAVYYYAVKSRRAAGAYHLFREGLVVVGPARGVRQIAWEQIGPERLPDPGRTRHTYPVDGGSDLVFDSACADHAALATAIAQRAARARWARLSATAGGPRPPAGRAVPAFLVYDPADALMYRVSPLGGHLLFVCAGGGAVAMGRAGAPPAHAQGALAGAAAGFAQYVQMKQVERLHQSLSSLEGADGRRLLELAYGFPGSRLIPAGELSDLHFAPPTSKETRSTGVRIAAVLRFKHAAWGEKALYFESRQQLTEAARLLGGLLNRDFGGELARAAALA